MSDHKDSKSRLNHGKTDGLNDADIKHLFDQQRDEPSQALDELILAAAKSTNEVVTEVNKPTRRPQKYTTAFGLAAMVLLGVVIVPLMLKQPEYTLDTNSVSNEDSVASLFEQESLLEQVQKIEQEPQSISAGVDQVAMAADVSAELANEQEAYGGGDAGYTTDDASKMAGELTSTTIGREPVLAKRTLKPAESQTESSPAQPSSRPRAITSASNKISASAKAPNSDVSTEERESPLKWVSAIKRLYEQNKLTQAKAELVRFRQQHPNSEHEALLPPALREQK
jgi:hypothetical protein